MHLSSATIEIAGGCSGLRYIMVGSAIATLLGELRNDSFRMRMQLLALATALAVIGNWIRVFVVILAGDLTHMQNYLVKRSHVGFGWCVFAVVMLIFFLIERRWPVTPLANPHEPGPFASPTGARSLGFARKLTLGLMVLMLAMPLTIGALISRNATAISSALPTLHGQWEGPRPLKSDWHPVFAGADSESQGGYYLGDVGVEVYTAWYATQQQGKNLNGYWNSVVGSSYALGAPTATALRGTIVLTGAHAQPGWSGVDGSLRLRGRRALVLKPLACAIVGRTEGCNDDEAARVAGAGSARALRRRMHQCNWRGSRFVGTC